MSQKAFLTRFDSEIMGSLHPAGMADEATCHSADKKRIFHGRVYVDRLTQLNGYETSVLNELISITAFITEIPRQSRGAVFEIGKEIFEREIFTVDSILSADESRVVYRVKECK